MKLNKQGNQKKKAYYFTGSGLFPVPAERVNEFEKLREEYHKRETGLAMLAARFRKVA